MKLLLVSNMYPSKKFPYYGTFVKNFEKTLVNKNVDIIRSVMKKNNGGKIKKIINYFYFYIKTLIKVAFTSYDILYVHFVSHSMFPIILCHYLGLVRKKIILNAHGSDVFPFKSQNFFLRKIVKISLNISDKVVVPSSYFKEEIIKKYNIKDSKIFISPSGGVNSKIFRSKKLRNYQDSIHLGYASRLEKGKGWDTFLQAIKDMNLDNVKVTVVGDGSDSEELKEKLLIYSLEDKVTLYPLLKQVELANCFNDFDCFVFPSSRESLGLVGIEAMACGCPVIGSNNSGISTYVENGINGFLFEVDSPEDLQEKINNYLSLSYKQKKEMSKNAIVTSKNYTEEIVAENIHLFLRNNLNF